MSSTLYATTDATTRIVSKEFHIQLATKVSIQLEKRLIASSTAKMTVKTSSMMLKILAVSSVRKSSALRHVEMNESMMHVVKKICATRTGSHK